MWVIEELGLIEYEKAYAYQQELVKRKHDGEKNNYFLLLEHYPVFTMGKGAKPDNIIDKSIPVKTINRGGDLTYHEPGQLVGYIIMDLKGAKLNVKSYITKIENLIINALQKLNIPAYRDPDIVGVWVEGKKVASIGIAIRKGITMHGFALNVNNNLEGFKKINPCGLESQVMSSINRHIPLKAVQQMLVRELPHSFS